MAANSIEYILSLKDLKNSLPAWATNPLTGIGAAAGFASQSAMKFDEGMAKVNVTAQLDEKGLDNLKEQIKHIAKDNRQEISLAPEGFEAIISQVGDVDTSLSILDAAMKGSRAGFTDLSVVSGALAQSLSVIGQENTNAQEVLDTFLAAKKVGAGEFADFANYLPNLIAGASNLGIAYKEVAGTYAFMTGKGQSAERAAVLMQNAFSVLGKGDIRKNLEKANIKVFDDAGKVRGLVDIFKDMSAVMGGMSDEMKSSFLESIGIVDKEAKSAFAILTSDTGGFDEAMQATVNSAGETEAALALAGNSMQSMTDLWTRFKNVGFELGASILPVINAGLDVLSGVLCVAEPVLSAVFSSISWLFDKLQEGNPLVWGLTAAISALTITINAATIAAKAKALWDGIVIGATKVWTGVQWTLNAAMTANPIGIVIAGIAILVGTIALCWQKFAGFRAVIQTVWDTVKGFGNILKNFIIDRIKGIIEGLGAIGKAFGKLFKGDFSGAWEAAKEGVSKFSGFEAAKNAFAGAKEVVGNVGTNFQANLANERAKDAAKAADKTSAAVEINNAQFNQPALDEKQQQALMNKLASGKKKGGKASAAAGKDTKTDLNDTVANMKGDSNYSAIMAKLSPVRLASLATKAAASLAVPAALAAAVPQSVALPSPVAAREEYRTESTGQGKTVSIDRFCDRIEIHIANADGKGYDQIRSEVENVLMDVLDDYEA
jgi:TP901 family phage tail tape measure protein